MNNEVIIVTGGDGFLGSHLVKLLKQKQYNVVVPKHANYDLRQSEDVIRLFSKYRGKIKGVINLAANVGGIGYNRNHPYNLFYDNIKINTNVIHQAINFGVEKFIQLSTTCAYPKFCPIPFREDHLWEGYPEEINAPYGLAKKMAMVQLESAYKEYGFNGITVIPTNLFGIGDNFMTSKSHVIPALIKRFYDAHSREEKEVEIWGSGNVSRDFLYVTDAAQAIVKVFEEYNNPLQPLNIGSGEETRISSLVYIIKTLMEYNGKIKYDTSMPDGQPARKLNIDNIKHSIGWQPIIKLQDGLKLTIEWYNDKQGKE